MEIVVISGGWVLVGEAREEGGFIVIRNAAVIRVWGTQDGLGQIAEMGPLPNTKLDPVPQWRTPLTSVLGIINCNQVAWQDYIDTRVGGVKAMRDAVE